ncbi:MAG: flagellar basal body L-ring protein FlgH [Candidatus Hydrogenedentota bacterium]
MNRNEETNAEPLQLDLFSQPAIAFVGDSAPALQSEPSVAPSARPVSANPTPQKRKRSRRKRGPGLAAKVIMGMSLVVALTFQASAVSLWQQGNGGGLFNAGKRSFKTGDIITIRIDETTDANHQWKTEREKEVTADGTVAPTGNGAGTKNLFGRFVPFINLDYEGKLSSDNQSDRRTSLTATVAAEVLNVLPNGNLQVIARKIMRVNSEEQLIELTGHIRPDDVSASNIVSSNAVANASIKVNGTLRYTNDERPSFLEKAFAFVTGIFF